VIKNCDLNNYDSETKKIEIAPVTNLDSYLGALHEIRHFILEHKTPINWDDEVSKEIECWE